MVQVINNETIVCPSCGEEHASQILAFPKSLQYGNQKLSLAEFYHTCPTDKIFFQTDKDICETFKLERKVKKQLDQQMNLWGVNNG